MGLRDFFSNIIDKITGRNKQMLMLPGALPYDDEKKKESKAKKAKPADKMEKTTIGDVTDLAALKEELLQQEKNQK